MALPRKQRRSTANVRGKCVSITVRPILVKQQESNNNQAMIVIPKRFVSKAVDRNRAKRQCFALLHEAFKQQGVGSIVVRVYTKPCTPSAIKAALAECLEKLRT